jgi:hypothetical protein
VFILLPHRSALVGAPVYVSVRDDLPVTVFAQKLPGLAAGRDREQRAGWERWVNELLSRALIEPPLTPAEVDALGEADRSAIGNTLLHAWGVSPTGDDILRELYAQDFLALVRRMAHLTHRLPTEILALSARDFWTNYAILFGAGSDDPVPLDAAALGGWGAG